jgi:hypothetical protein
MSALRAIEDRLGLLLAALDAVFVGGSHSGREGLFEAFIGDADGLAELGRLAAEFKEQLNALDDKSDLSIEAFWESLPVPGSSEPFALLRSRIVRLQSFLRARRDRIRRPQRPELRPDADELEKTRARLRNTEDPSFKLAIVRYVRMWRRETGEDVTVNPYDGVDNYTGEPKSPSGCFILAAMEASAPSEDWICEHSQFATGKMTDIWSKERLGRKVHSILRHLEASAPEELKAEPEKNWRKK